MIGRLVWQVLPNDQICLSLGGHILPFQICCLLHNGANSRTVLKILWFFFGLEFEFFLICYVTQEMNFYYLHTKFIYSGQNPLFYDSAHIEILVNLLYPHQALGIK